MRRALEVTPEVFHLIWSNWKEGDTDENSILRRLLFKLEESSTISSPQEITLTQRSNHGYLATGMTPRAVNNEENEERFYAHKELDINNEAINMMTSTSYQVPPAIGKIRWVDDVRSALIDLGGEAELSRIYEKTEEHRKAGGRSIVRSLDATVRQTLEAHSSDSQNFKPGNADYFAHIARGRWRLR